MTSGTVSSCQKGVCKENSSTNVSTAVGAASGGKCKVVWRAFNCMVACKSASHRSQIVQSSVANSYSFKGWVEEVSCSEQAAAQQGSVRKKEAAPMGRNSGEEHTMVLRVMGVDGSTETPPQSSPTGYAATHCWTQEETR